jgi:hypothetical protein
MGLWVFLLKNNEKSAKIISETKNLKKMEKSGRG